MPAERLASQQAVDESARLCGVTPRQWPRDDRNVPAPADGIYWSLSHKPAWTAGVVSDEPVGIDLEAIAPRRNTIMWNKIATPAEWDLIRKSPLWKDPETGAEFLRPQDIIGRLDAQSADTELFTRMLDGGARFLFCDDARVVETVPAERQRLVWLTQALN